MTSKARPPPTSLRVTCKQNTRMQTNFNRLSSGTFRATYRANEYVIRRGRPCLADGQGNPQRFLPCRALVPCFVPIYRLREPRKGRNQTSAQWEDLMIMKGRRLLTNQWRFACHHTLSRASHLALRAWLCLVRWREPFIASYRMTMICGTSRGLSLLLSHVA